MILSRRDSRVKDTVHAQFIKTKIFYEAEVLQHLYKETQKGFLLPAFKGTDYSDLFQTRFKAQLNSAKFKGKKIPSNSVISAEWTRPPCLTLCL